mmetsp:Transcript_20452/g.41671  ORF Transcript_20452/g.41671 Transcript_20452/m.41671 type:complete len:103 (-) Transcript_20452:992-1300(-)
MEYIFIPTGPHFIVILPYAPALVIEMQCRANLSRVLPVSFKPKRKDAAMAERLKRKAELQKKMSRPMNYQESMKAEQERQKGMKKSKQEMRNALCEELGRGC